MTTSHALAGVHAVEVPREIVNADSVYVVSWAVADGDRVEAGSALCDIETSKAVVTVEAEAAGFARPVARVGDEVAVGGLLGYVTDAPDTPLPGATAHRAGDATPRSAATASPSRITAKARLKIEELGLDAALFEGRGVVREEDVLAVAARGRSAAPLAEADSRPVAAAPAEDPRGPSRIEAMGTIQRRVARVMEQSARTIPSSSLERMVDLAPLRERAARLGAAAGLVVTEVDLLVHALASACRDFPEFNAHATADHRLRFFDQVNVGVAVDAAGDLYVVVVRDAASKSVEAVAKELRSLQYLAARGRLGPQHLGGGTVTMTSMLGRGVNRFVPIPYPEQAAIVGLADPEPGSTKAALVLVFDHRVASGGRAAAFLAAVAAILEEA